MSTLVVSDLHLGSRLRHDVLTQPEPLHRLLGALEGIERLVLLGDVVELLEKRAERAMDIAEPILRLIGGTLGVDGEVIFVPGNHDRPLVAGWIERVGSGLAPDSRVPSKRPRSWPASPRVLRRRASGCTTRACGSALGCGRRTGITSIATCCLRPRSALRAVSSGACPDRARHRLTTSRPEGRRSPASKRA